MPTEKEIKEKFPGFPPEPQTNYWPYPRAMNGWWHILTGSEQKVLDYILRHTWGYQKTEDSISYDQFINGIIKKNGEILDRGCGIKSSKTLCKALVGLEKKSFIEKIKITGTTNRYKLKIDAEGVKSKELWEKVKKGVGESKEVAMGESKDTITDNTINNKQYNDLPEKELIKTLVNWNNNQSSPTPNAKEMMKNIIRKYGYNKVSEALTKHGPDRTNGYYNFCKHLKGDCYCYKIG